MEGALANAANDKELSRHDLRQKAWAQVADFVNQTAGDAPSSVSNASNEVSSVRSAADADEGKICFFGGVLGAPARCQLVPFLFSLGGLPY